MLMYFDRITRTRQDNLFSCAIRTIFLNSMPFSFWIAVTCRKTAAQAHSRGQDTGIMISLLKHASKYDCMENCKI